MQMKQLITWLPRLLYVSIMVGISATCSYLAPALQHEVRKLTDRDEDERNH